MTRGSKDILLERLRGGGHLSMGESAKLSLLLSYPAILAQLSSIVMQYIDTAMVGHLGAAAGASIGLVSTCIWLFGGFAMACSSGFSVQVAHLCGASDFKGAREIVRQGLVCALIFSCFLALAGLAVAGPLPRWIGGPEDVVGDASVYFGIMSIALPALQIDFICASMLQASGNMKVPSILNIMMCVLDVGFNYIFIYLLDMGVTGAAIGTCCAELICAVAMLLALLRGSKELSLRHEKGSFAPSRKVVQKALRISVPMGLQNILLRGAHIASTVIVAPLGTVSIAANAFAITAESFCYMPGYGIADAATSLVGQSCGAGRKDLARRFAWITTSMGMVIMTLTAALMWIFAPQLMGMLTPDAAVIELGAKVLRLEAFAETMYAASIVAYGACVGIGDTKIPSIMNFTSMWIVRIIPAAILTPKIGLMGFWIAMCVELNFRGIIFLARIARRSTWK